MHLGTSATSHLTIRLGAAWSTGRPLDRAADQEKEPENSEKFRALTLPTGAIRTWKPLRFAEAFSRSNLYAL